jgi:hypothetical protein
VCLVHGTAPQQILSPLTYTKGFIFIYQIGHLVFLQDGRQSLVVPVKRVLVLRQSVWRWRDVEQVAHLVIVPHCIGITSSTVKLCCCAGVWRQNEDQWYLGSVVRNDILTLMLLFIQ